jgi:hypothetical protein
MEFPELDIYVVSLLRLPMHSELEENDIKCICILLIAH